jgi:hypothetical protein
VTGVGGGGGSRGREKRTSKYKNLWGYLHILSKTICVDIFRTRARTHTHTHDITKMLRKMRRKLLRLKNEGGA